MLAALWLLWPLARTGPWDPLEPDTADLGRRVAVHALGADALARPEDPPTIPTLTDLGSGELAFSSVALSFRVFGFHAWSGRLPMALWGLAGALSLYWMLHRLVHPRAAFFALVALVTMPLYFLHARTMLGDIVAMAAFTMAVSGFTVASFERGTGQRVLGVGLGLAGLLAGFLSRGLLLGVAAPALAAGVTGLLSPRDHRPHRFRSALAASLLVAGVAAGAWFLHVALPLVGQGGAVPRVVGMTLLDPTPADSTFDRIVRQLGHGLFPWTALAPIAIGRLLSRQPSRGLADGRTTGARLALLIAAGFAFAANALIVPWAGALPYLGPAMLAGAIGVLAFDLADQPPTRLEALASTALLALVYVDLKREPSRTLAPFMVDAQSFPSTFLEDARGRLLPVVLVAGAATFLCLFDDRSDGPAPTRTGAPVRVGALLRETIAARRAGARALGAATYHAFRGNLVFVAVIVEAALIGLAGMLLIGTRAGWSRIAALPKSAVEVGLSAWWFVPLALLAAALAYLLARDGLRLVARIAGLSRGAIVIVACGLAGSLLSFGFYPALGDQLSPKGAFEVFEDVRGPGDQLALLGMSPRAGLLYVDAPLVAWHDVDRAHAWLAEPSTPRRFLVLKARDLPRLNSLWRAQHARSVAVLDARSSQNVLVSSELRDQVDHNPFRALILDQPPSVARPLSTRFREHIEAIGWEVLDADGRSVTTVVPRVAYRVRFVYRILKRITGTWKAFLHVDSGSKRYNADHSPLGGSYPMSLWQPGDIVVDEVEMTLEPNFTPGECWVYFGFFQGETRMAVTDGAAQKDRAIAGHISVQ